MEISFGTEEKQLAFEKLTDEEKRQIEWALSKRLSELIHHFTKFNEFTIESRKIVSEDFK